MKEISKIEYTAFIPEGEKPKDPKTAAMIGAPSGTIEKGIIEAKKEIIESSVG